MKIYQDLIKDNTKNILYFNFDKKVEEIILNNKAKIKFIPLWKWFLEQ